MQPDSQNVAAYTGDVVGQVQAQARRLGLTWQMVKATTVGMGVDGTTVLAVVDGDTEILGMISMVGALPVGARVWVMVVPPGGNYVTALVTGGAAFYSARQTLAASAASIVFTQIPQRLRRLRVSFRARADNAVDVQSMLMRVDGSSAAAYFWEYGQAQNAATTAVPGTLQTSGVVGLCTGSTAAAGAFASGMVEFQSWDISTAIDLPWTFVSEAIGISTTGFTARYGGGFYSGTFPWDSLTFLPNAGNFIAGTDIQLEGWPT